MLHLLPHLPIEIDVNSSETTMATIVIGAQWGDEVGPLSIPFSQPRLRVRDPGKIAHIQLLDLWIMLTSITREKASSSISSALL
jgi:hypothetical protein